MAKLLIMDRQCDQCLFSKNRIVSKPRATEIIRSCLATDTHFICHKSDNYPIACRGFYDAYPYTLIFKLVKVCNIPIVEIDTTNGSEINKNGRPFKG